MSLMQRLAEQSKSGTPAQSSMLIQDITKVPVITVADCKEGVKYKLPGGEVATFSGVSRDFGFFDLADGTIKKCSVTMTVELITLPAPQAPATPAVSAPVEPAKSVSEITPPAQTAAVIPPDAPKSNPALAAEAPPAPVAETPKRKRRTKEEIAADDAAVKAHEAELDATEPQAASGPLAPAVVVYVDCLPNAAAQPLAPYIGKIAAQIEKTFDAVDIRCAPKKQKDGAENPLAFGGWKGVLASAIKAEPPAPGIYVILGTAGSEIAQVAVEALESVCTAPGSFVRGVR
jgi:hypothetical protein